MKRLFFIMLIFTLIVACKDQKETEVKTTTVDIEAIETEEKAGANVHYAKAEFTIEGMTCAVGCAATIEKNLAGMEGVKTAKVNFEDKLAMVEYDASKLGVEDLAMTVTTTGDGETYKVLNMTKAGDKTPEKAMACSEDCDKSCCKEKKTK